MQTFLPLPSFVESARCLDRQRLGKQRIECKQILAALGYHIMEDGTLLDTGGSAKAGWVNHPATKMWRGYEMALAMYQAVMILEWKRRGYQNTMDIFRPRLGETIYDPPWLGDEAFHASHRANLLRKDPTHYGQFGWTESPDLPYVWPVSQGEYNGRS